MDKERKEIEQKNCLATFGNGAFLVAQTVKNLPEMQETGVRSLGWEVPLKKGMATHSSIPSQRIPWVRDPGGLTVHGVTMSQM